MPEFVLAGERALVDVIVESGMVKSKNEARRLIQQGGIELDNSKISDINAKISQSGIMKVGSRRFLKLVCN